MRSSTCAIVLFLPAVMLTVTASATILPTEDPVILKGELAERIQIEEGWRYRPGDDPVWADPAFDDSRWTVASSLLRPAELPEDGWQVFFQRGFPGMPIHGFGALQEGFETIVTQVEAQRNTADRRGNTVASSNEVKHMKRLQ